MGERNLYLKRLIFTDESTIGDLYWDGGEFECHTLEDSCRRDKNADGRLTRDEKVYGATAIPSGRYEIRMDYSPRYKRKMPFLFGYLVGRGDPKNLFNDVMIHWGNWAKDTNGCILVGERIGGRADFISASQKNYNELEPKIIEALKYGKVYINVEGGLKA